MYNIHTFTFICYKGKIILRFNLRQTWNSNKLICLDTILLIFNIHFSDEIALKFDKNYENTEMYVVFKCFEFLENQNCSVDTLVILRD